MTTINPSIAIVNPNAKRVRIIYGIVLLAVGLLIYLVFGLNTEAGLQTTFGLNLSGSQAIPVPDLAVPAQLTRPRMPTMSM